MILVDTLRDRVDDVIADMEKQFAPAAARIETLVAAVLAGDRGAYAQLQAFGRDLVAPMIERYGTATGALAADWYDLNRALAQIGGTWPGAVVQAPNVDTGPLIGGVVKDFGTIESVVSGIQAGMELRVRQAGHGTIMDSVLRDPRASGWGRVASAGCCSYCALLATRGNVYRTSRTATFSPHEHCRCEAVPAWGGSTASMRSREDTIATRRNLTDRQRATQNSQARSWIEANKDTLGLIQSAGSPRLPI